MVFSAETSISVILQQNNKFQGFHAKVEILQILLRFSVLPKTEILSHQEGIQANILLEAEV